MKLFAKIGFMLSVSMILVQINGASYTVFDNISDGIIFSSVTSTSLIQCATRCSWAADCDFFYFKKKNNLCQLGKLDMTNTTSFARKQESEFDRTYINFANQVCNLMFFKRYLKTLTVICHGQILNATYFVLAQLINQITDVFDIYTT